MSKDEFLKLLHNQPGWSTMIQRGTAGVKVCFKGVYIEIFRDSSNHFLRFLPWGDAQADVVAEFNNLWSSCKAELKEELEQSNMERLTRDDNEGDC